MQSNVIVLHDRKGSMSDKSKDDDQDKAAVTFSGTVMQVIPLFHPSMAEKAEISVDVPTIYIERFGSRIPMKGLTMSARNPELRMM